MVAISQQTIEKLKYPDYWLQRYTYWGNPLTWVEYYRRKNLNATIDECYNSLDENIGLLLRVFNKNKPEAHRGHSLRKLLVSDYSAEPHADPTFAGKSLPWAEMGCIHKDCRVLPFVIDTSHLLPLLTSSYCSNQPLRAIGGIKEREIKYVKCATSSSQSSTDDEIAEDGIADEEIAFEDDKIADDKYGIGDDDNEHFDLNDSQNRKRKRNHVTYPMLTNYYRILLAMQDLHIEEDSQRARHSFAMLEWSVINFEIFEDAGWQGERKPATISIPQIELKLLSPIFEKHFDSRIQSVIAMLRSLERKGKIVTSSLFNSWFGWLWGRSRSYYYLDALTCISVLSTVISYIPTPCRGLGSKPSENHELWTSILFNAFSFHNPKFFTAWEFYHLVPGNGGRGSAKSDFSAIVRNKSDLQFAFFLAEFEQEVHKDDVVIVAEAAHEFNRILSLMHYPSEEEINKTCLHVGLVNGTRIRLGKLMPAFNQQQATLIYVYDDEVISFNLQEKDEEANIESALQLLTYIRETICMNGMRIKSLLNRRPAKFNACLKASLPKLPNEAVKSRKYNTKFTPRSKRQRYTADLLY
ncbi:5312_t:CDS:2 [Funneliformis geosporum]|uniref:5312_t:CDS:1 n=1 Tax=Funneliformis geosporum TaxID=1117311 RepID=A0A9W4SU67_9GLOM|nr:5312_t:CDS:2 [Funneliformis geosporum]